MVENNTVVSAYTMYRHLQQYCSYPWIWTERRADSTKHMKTFVLWGYHKVLFPKAGSFNLACCGRVHRLTWVSAFWRHIEQSCTEHVSMK